MENGPVIEWSVLGTAIQYYTRVFGYTYIEVPWIVPDAVNMITCPHERLLMKINETGTSLVGSAEQSFLKLQLDKRLPPGKYIACSPCFRFEEAYDHWHFPTFMKVELYRTDRTDQTAFIEMVDDAESFFTTEIVRHWSTGQRPSVKQVTTDIGIDLMINGVEVGSYGIRSTDDVTWVYGTGVALPRLTQAIGRARYQASMPAIFQKWTDGQITMMIEAAQEFANQFAGAPNVEQYIMNMWHLLPYEAQWLLEQKR